MQEDLKKLAELVRGARSAVFFGGAGVSTESGIPDFRSAKGIYSGKHEIPPETLLSAAFLWQEPAAFYAYYRQNLLHPDAKPNAAHIALAEWEQAGKLSAVITQNIDGLHQLAGSQKVIELHGSVHRNHCAGCHKAHPLSRMMDEAEPVPTCGCGGMIRPDVVLYGENLDSASITEALKAINGSDLLIIGGTSLQVYPAAGFVQGYRGKLVLINKSPTSMDAGATLCLRGSIAELLGSIPISQITN